jgi:hypothetical protein
MTVNPAYQILTAWGSLFAISFGRNVIEGFLGRVFGGRPLQAVFYVVGIGAIVVFGGNWLLMRFGRTVEAEVRGKQEVVEVQRDGSWTRETTVTAVYTPRGLAGRAPVQVPVGAAVYDLVRGGERIPIRCVPLLPTFCLLKYDSLPEWGLRALQSAVERGQALFVLGLPIVMFWLGIAEWNPERRVRRWISRLLFAAWAVALLHEAAVPERTAGSGPRRQVTARIRDIHYVSHYGLLNPLIRIPISHPYALVQLAVSPTGRGDTVVAMDAVDSLTATHLTVQASFIATYPASDPRAAELAGAGRRFRQGNVARNVLLTLALLLILVVPVVVLELARGSARQPVPVGGSISA